MPDEDDHNLFNNEWMLLPQQVHSESGTFYLFVVHFRPLNGKNLDHVYLRHLSTEYWSILSAGMLTNSRLISRLILSLFQALGAERHFVCACSTKSILM